MTTRTRRTTVTAAVSGVALLAAAGLALTSSAGNAAGDRQTTLDLKYKDAAFSFVDVAPQHGESGPFTMGDTFYIGDTLLESGKKVGYADLVCSITKPGPANSKSAHSQCQATLELRDGTITASGIVPLADATETYAITGGTGVYRSASGEIVEPRNGHRLTVSLDQ